MYTSRERVSPPSFSGERTLKNNITFDVDSKIKQYEFKFKELKVAFRDRVILQAGITVSRILDNIKNLCE
jgi:hypothetical protein